MEAVAAHLAMAVFVSLFLVLFDVFSHFHLDITPLEIPVQIIGTRDSNGRWVDPAAPGELGLAAPVKKLLGRLDTPRQTSML